MISTPRAFWDEVELTLQARGWEKHHYNSGRYGYLPPKDAIFRQGEDYCYAAFEGGWNPPMLMSANEEQRRERSLEWARVLAQAAEAHLKNWTEYNAAFQPKESK